MRMKVFCQRIDKDPHNDGKFNLEFTAVYDGSEENNDFWEATPSGSIELVTVNPEAVKGIEVGAEFYVDFTRAG